MKSPYVWSNSETRLILATVSSQPQFFREVQAALDGRLAVEAAWELSYDDVGNLSAAAAEKKCLLFMDVQDLLKALAVAPLLDGSRLVVAIAANGDGSREELVTLMQAGFRDVVPHFQPGEILEAAIRGAGRLQGSLEQSGDLFAFVPAKPGCGATTLATYATAVAAQRSQEPTLLLDFDIRLGITSFLLRVEGTHTILDALEQAERLDADLWSSLVCQRDMLHILGSGPVEFTRSFPPKRFNDLLDFAIRQYNTVSVDLPGTMEHYECAALLRAKRIYLVCTPEIGALHVARRKSNRLRDLRLGDNVAVILNRFEKRSTFSIKDIEQIVQLPVRYVVPSGADEVARAVHKGVILEGSSPVARQIGRLAADMIADRPMVKKPNPVRRFVEYFSISPARQGGGGSHE